MKNKGFTLIELLVVIAIIGLLLAIIVPSLSKAKVMVEEVICRTNIRQYGLAGKMYLEENDAKFPIAWSSIYKQLGPDTQCQFHDVTKHPDRRPELEGILWNYIGGGGKVHYCPTFAKFMKSGEPHPGHNAAIPIEPLFCYSMNAFLGGFEGDTPATQSLRVSLGDIKTPSRVFFFAEENGWNYPTGVIVTRYSYTLNDNALCGAPEHPYNATAWSNYPLAELPATTNYVDAIGSFHKTTLQKRHAGKGNAVFIDGHVGLIEPKMTYYHTKWSNVQPKIY
jgi:prepilin-type N-terminal cleavage/methylation domain-containing protein/prepilin-type processing-associated H-X9-DG protein